MTKDERKKLREAARAVKIHAANESLLAPLLDWQLQTSNSFRRIGQRGDGDVLCATVQPSDNHPDLHAAPGVLDFIVAAQPRVVLALLDQLDALEDAIAEKQAAVEALSRELAEERVTRSKLNEIERRVAALATALFDFGSVAVKLARPTDSEVTRKVYEIIEQLDASLREVSVWEGKKTTP